MKKTLTIQGHTVLLNIERGIDSQIEDIVIMDISESIVNGLNNGSNNTPISYTWEIEEEVSYLDKKIEILEEKDAVIFEKDNLIFKIILRSDNSYEIEYYDFTDFINGNTLDTKDATFFDGSAADAIYYAITMK